MKSACSYGKNGGKFLNLLLDKTPHCTWFLWWWNGSFNLWACNFLQNDAVFIKNPRPHMMLSMSGSMRWDWPWIVRWECVLGRNDILKKNSREPLAQAQGRVVNQWSKKEILLFTNLCTCLCGILEFLKLNFIVIWIKDSVFL